MAIYNDLLNVDDFWEKKITFEENRWEVSFYCKDCEEIVETERTNPKWYIFKCKKCNSTNISIWTTAWIKENYRIK